MLVLIARVSGHPAHRESFILVGSKATRATDFWLASGLRPHNSQKFGFNSGLNNDGENVIIHFSNTPTLQTTSVFPLIERKI